MNKNQRLYVIGVCLGFFIGLVVGGTLHIAVDNQLSVEELEKSCLAGGGRTYPTDCQDGASRFWCNTCGEICYWGDAWANSPDHHEIHIMKNPCAGV